MKRSLKWLTFVLAAIMLFSLVGCNNTQAPVSSEATPGPDGTTPEPVGDATPGPTATPDPYAALKFWDREFDKDVYYICLIGSDEESPAMEGCIYGHNDTTMILQVDVKNNTMRLASFMRDMYVDIPGKGKHRLNNAYFRGGPDLVKKTIKSVFDVEIDYYAKVTFTTFMRIMDTIINNAGPIMLEVQPDEVETLRVVKSGMSMDGEPVKGYNDIQTAGLHDMNPYQLITYARDRHSARELEDGKTVWNDLGRTDRQRAVIQATWNKVKEQDSSLVPLAASLGQAYVETDMDVGLMITMLSHCMEGNITMEDKGFPTSYWEILVNRDTGEEFSKDDLKALYDKEKAEYEAAATPAPSEGSGDGSETGEGSAEQPAEEKEPFPSYEDWLSETSYDSVIGFSSKTARRLHQFFGIN